MAERKIGGITLYERVDNAKLAAWIAAGDDLLFDVNVRYDVGALPQTITAVLPAQFDDLTIDYMEALQRTIDASSFIIEKDAFVFNVVYDPATAIFDLSNSYMRTTADTETPAVMYVGALLRADFITPALPVNIITSVTLEYDLMVDTALIDALAAVGIVVDPTSTGSNLIITAQPNSYQVSFYMPDSSTANYVIDFNYNNIVITP